MGRWICTEWRFELVFIVVVSSIVGLWCVEYNRLRPACWAETDLKAGQFLTVEDLGGADAKTFVGTFLNGPKEEGSPITNKDISTLRSSQAVVALQVSEKQLRVSTFEIGTCIEVRSRKATAASVGELKVVSIGPTSNATTSVLFLTSRDDSKLAGLHGGEEVAFAIVGCPDALKPSASPTLPAEAPPAPPKVSAAQPQLGNDIGCDLTADANQVLQPKVSPEIRGEIAPRAKAWSGNVNIVPSISTYQTLRQRRSDLW